MEHFKLTLKNYRCFEHKYPATLNLGPGFVGIVGPNNSGKSSLLRSFYELRGLWTIFAQANTYTEHIIKNSWNITFHDVRDQLEVFNHQDRGPLSVRIELQSASQSSCSGVEFTFSRSPNPACHANLYSPGGQLVACDIAFQGDRVVVGQSAFELSGIYSLLSSFRNAMYIGSFRNALNAGASTYYDLQVGTQFVEEWNRWKNGADKVKSSRIQEASSDIQRILGFESLEINASDDRQTLQVFVDRRPYRLCELGAGLAQFIVTFGAAATRQPSIILIDEPELNLHPTLQVDFLTSLGKYASEGVWFSTHSMGLARSVAEAVYTTQKVGTHSVVNALAMTENYVLFLGEMSYTAYREMGFEKIMLVEGPTEVKTLQQWLRFYGKEHRVVVMHLGGSSSINAKSTPELAELKRITQEIVVLIDSERSFEAEPIAADRGTFIANCRELQFEVLATARRATENYFTDSAIKAVKGDKYSALTPYQLLKTATPAWAKHENWRIAACMRKEELDDTDVGGFLAAL